MLWATILVQTLMFVPNLIDSSGAESLYVVVTADVDGTSRPEQQQQQHPPQQRRIYMSDGRQLLNFTNDDEAVMIDCEMTDDKLAIRRAIWLRGRPVDETDVIDALRDYEDVGGIKFQEWKRTCQVVQQRRASPVHKRKVFPEMVYPGTKWCGPGDDAEDYDDIGRLKNADKCCRAHDLCPVHILAFETKYHYFNYRPYTVTHCTCDENLFNCLKTTTAEVPAERKDSNIIGDVFFKEVNPPCFRLERQKYCVKRHWSQIWCMQWDWSDRVAVVRTYLAGQWFKVNNTDEIPNKPPTQPIQENVRP